MDKILNHHQTLSLWINANQSKYFLIPMNENIPDGDFLVFTILGEEKSVDINAIIPFEITETEAKQYLEEIEDGWDILPTLTSPYALPKICLYHLGLKEFLTPAQQNTMTLERLDFRFSHLRRELYEKIRENENESYYEMSIRLGYDIRKFYNNRK
jgi:hypothetical protein